MRTIAAEQSERDDPMNGVKRSTRVNSALVGVREALDDLAGSLVGLDEKWAALEAAREEFEKAVRSTRQHVSVKRVAAQLCKLEHPAPTGTSHETLHGIASVRWE